MHSSMAQTDKSTRSEMKNEGAKQQEDERERWRKSNGKSWNRTKRWIERNVKHIFEHLKFKFAYLFIMTLFSRANNKCRDFVNTEKKILKTSRQWTKKGKQASEWNRNNLVPSPTQTMTVTTATTATKVDIGFVPNADAWFDLQTF